MHDGVMRHQLKQQVLFLNLLGASFLCLAAQPSAVPTLDEAIASKLDLWGDAAMRQPNGPSYEFFHDYLQRLEGPKFAEGYLPIVELKFLHGDGSYAQETFASTDPVYASNAVTLTRFTYHASATSERAEKGRMVVRLDTRETLKPLDDRLLNEKGEALL